jgi:hypothetical protein
LPQCRFFSAWGDAEGGFRRAWRINAMSRNQPSGWAQAAGKKNGHGDGNEVEKKHRFFRLA